MRSSLVITVSALVLALAVPALAGKKEEKQARKAFKEGVAHFEAGRMEEAVESFRKAYNISPSWKLLYNIGQAEAAAKHHGAALEAFEQYLSEGGDDLPPARRDEVVDEIRRLREMVGLLEFDAPDGSLIYVDGVERGTTPLPGRIRVSAGVDHEVKIVLGAEVLVKRVLRVGGNETLVVSTAPDPPPPPPPGSPTSGEAGDDGDPVKTWGWITTSLGAALLITGGITGGVALSKNNDIESNCPGGDCEPPFHDDVDTRDALATTTNVLLSVGAAAAVAGILMLTVPGGEEDPSGEVSVLPLAGDQTAGAALEWRF
jgi:hypothetical protein